MKTIQNRRTRHVVSTKGLKDKLYCQKCSTDIDPEDYKEIIFGRKMKSTSKKADRVVDYDMLKVCDKCKEIDEKEQSIDKG